MAELAGFEHVSKTAPVELRSGFQFQPWEDTSSLNARFASSELQSLPTLDDAVGIKLAAGPLGDAITDGNFSDFDRALTNLIGPQDPSKIPEILSNLETTLKESLKTSREWGLNSIQYDPEKREITVGIENRTIGQVTPRVIVLPPMTPWQR